MLAIKGDYSMFFQDKQECVRRGSGVLSKQGTGGTARAFG